jgi:hypothetical protein
VAPDEHDQGPPARGHPYRTEILVKGLAEGG